jgi:hypothetical protein
LRKLLMTAVLLTPLLVHAQERTPAPPGAKAYIVTPADGAKVSGPVTVRFGLKGMGIAPAGVTAENTGHHHLLIDTPLPSDMSLPLPVVEGKVVHFGKGQTETEVNLPPGPHTLQLVLGDATHRPHNPPVVSDVVHITVTKMPNQMPS